MKLTDVLRNRLLKGGDFATYFDSGTIKIYSGTVPATADTALGAQVLLAQATFGADAFAAASSGSMAANAITADSSADAAGNPSFARICTSGGTAGAQVTVGKTGGAEELLINTVDGSSNPYIAAGGSVSVSSLTVTLPAGT